MDPYALGLLLGDGCLTTSTTPSFTTADPELAVALGAALDGIELRARLGRLRAPHTAGHRGGVIVANPVTATLRDLGLAGTRSNTKFVPERYLHNSSEVRLAVLQGLLDSDGGPVTQRGRTCRIQYGTSSPRSGTTWCSWSAPSAGSPTGGPARPPARARTCRGRDVHHRSTPTCSTSGCPSGIAPFRLSRKQSLATGACGGPMRSSTASSRGGG
jgi:phosphate starvation-inducible PhoH-like protein